MSMTMEFTDTLVVTSCWCGIRLAIPTNLHRHMKESDRNSCYCPVGHTFVFNESFEKKYEAEQRRHAATRDLLRAEERSHSATKGVLTKARKRAAAGVCPCCQRSFQNVARHVKTKHPDYDPEKAS